jgi:hypothetical protein
MVFSQFDMDDKYSDPEEYCAYYKADVLPKFLAHTLLISHGDVENFIGFRTVFIIVHSDSISRQNRNEWKSAQCGRTDRAESIPSYKSQKAKQVSIRTLLRLL